ncbi:hypothetical protein PLEOSDRAFT_1106212 [Pleurotus ostreatus PC15]|uniref:FAD-binding domain-containing protein n=2 Tax=Pleurotus TaxID=5320 RepID=A0A067NME9_PLEO1|nr:hypothetical protein CCMSSC00406_0004275 [Pleurotus cornucopiae]KDQ25272.1 hypothetical protein PLEOSDRAFT_1106212 [Pleurotus ostreatus PC15]
MSAFSKPSLLLTHNGYALIAAFLGIALTVSSYTAWYFYRKVTREWELNLSLLGHPRGVKFKQTVVICGGSIAGLISARVCADHFQNVVIVDPEITKAGQEFAKKRVAQYDSLHAYLTFMVDGLRRLWPNLDPMIEQAGGVFRPGDFKLNFGGIPLLAAQSSYPTTIKTAAGFEKTNGLPDTMLIRRPKFEAVLYRLLIDSSANSIQTIQGTVTGLVPSDDMSDIRSVNIRTNEGEEKTVKDVALVIDCTGSTQAGIKWLKSAGFISSLESSSDNKRGPDNLRISYDHKLRYVTVTFDNLGDLVHTLPIPGGFEKAGFIYTYYAHCKWGNEGFVLTRMDNTIQLCCGGWGDVHLPKEKEDILPYVRSVKGAYPAPQWVRKVVEMLLESEQNGDAVITFKPLKIPAPSFVQYHKITHLLPSNFIAIGDSEMQLNPLFAQGCSKALFSAMTLNTVLHNRVASNSPNQIPKDFSTLYFQRSHNTLEDIWKSTKAIDYGYPTTIPIKEESRDREGAAVRWYAYHAARAAERDEVVASALWHVRMLATPQAELFRPRVIFGVLRWAVMNAISQT